MKHSAATNLPSLLPGKHDYLKRVAVAQRPRMLWLFPWGTSYFRSWQTLRWFLLLVVPIIGSALLLGFHRHEIVGPLFVGFVGTYGAACLFVELCSGMASSNWGTHFRQTEPVRYWIQISMVTLAYLALSSLGFVAHFLAK